MTDLFTLSAIRWRHNPGIFHISLMPIRGDRAAGITKFISASRPSPGGSPPKQGWQFWVPAPAARALGALLGWIQPRMGETNHGND